MIYIRAQWSAEVESVGYDAARVTVSLAAHLLKIFGQKYVHFGFY